MAVPSAKKANLSGKAWWTTNQAKTLYSNSTSIDKLDATFKLKVNQFKKAITGAGAKVVISTTRRSENRAYILHWSWKIAKGLVTVGKVPAKKGVDITWDHGDTAASKKGAQEIVKAANIAYQPSCNRSFPYIN